MSVIGEREVIRRRYGPPSVVNGRERLPEPSERQTMAAVAPASKFRLRQDPQLDDVTEAVTLVCEQLDWRTADPDTGTPPDRLVYLDKEWEVHEAEHIGGTLDDVDAYWQALCVRRSNV